MVIQITGDREGKGDVMTNLPKVSATKLKMFSDCKNQYAAKYIYHMQPKKLTNFNVLGLSTHAAIDAGYKGEFPYPVFDTVMEHELSKLDGKELFPYNYSRTKIKDMGYAFLDNFDYDRLTPKHIEYPFELPYAYEGQDPICLYTGIIDYIGGCRDVPGEGILDFKTNKEPFSQNDVDKSIQLAIYFKAYTQLFGKLPDFIGIYHIPTDTITFTDLINLHVTLDEVDMLIHDMLLFAPPKQEELTRCAKCSIFCSLKWE